MPTAAHATPPAVASAPRRARTPAEAARTRKRLWIAGLTLIAAGITCVVFGYRGQGSPDGEGPELAAPGGGTLAASTPAWKPTELGYDDLRIGGGSATTVPDPGTTRLAELARQVAPAAPVVTTPGPATPAPGGSVLDPLLDYVPQEAFAVAAIDLAQARTSPPVGKLVDLLVAQTGQNTIITSAARAGGLEIRGAGKGLVVAAIPAGPGADPWPLAIIAGPLDEARVEAQLVAAGGTAGARDAEGVTIAQRGVSVLIRQDLLVIAPAAVLERAVAARAGDSAADAGGLRDALLASHSGTAGFLAVRMIDDLRKEASGLLPDLATALWFAGTLDVASGITVTAIGAFPDDATAARMAASAEIGKSFGANELRAKNPVAAGALTKIAATTAGATTRLTATFDSAEAEALIDLAR